MQAKELIETVGQFDVVGSTGIDLRQAFADAVGQETVVWKMGRAGKQAADEIDQLMKEILSDDSTFDA